jgi:endonuclease YncB( thermonuclease family)
MGDRPHNILPFRRPRRRVGWFLPALIALPLGAFSAVFFWGGPPEALAIADIAKPAAPDPESARFAICGSGARIDCVVDGDTFWYRGEKIRIADINTPEVSEPGCAAEASLGRRATNRLLVLRNEGPFTLEPGGHGRDRDPYGRLLRTVTRQGDSLGDVLVDDGLAEEWQGYRRDWC